MIRLIRLFQNTVLLLLLVASGPIASAQGKISDKIKKIINEATTEIDETRQFLEKIGQAEALAEKNNQPLDYFRIYKAKALFCYNNKNYEDCKKYAQKFELLIRYCKDPIELARTYEDLFVFDHSKNKEAINNLFKAHALFKRHGKPEDLIDVNYNLSQEYQNREEWNKSIKHAIDGLALIKSTGQKKGRAKYLYLYMLESYTALGNLEKASKSLKTADSIRQTLANADYTTFQYLFYGNAVNFYKKTGQYKKVAEISDAAFKALLAKRKLEVKKVNDALRLEKDLQVKQDELKRIRLENKLKEEQIKKAYIIIVFITVLLVFLALHASYLRKTSKKTRSLNQALEQKNANLSAITVQLEDALSAKTDFLNVMTHELFTPINGIAIIAQNLRKEISKREFTQNLELLEFSSNYLYRLLKNIVDAKSIEKKDLRLNLDAVNLKAFIRLVAKAARIFLKTSSNRFQYAVDDKIPDPLLVDSVKLSQILINLLNNANKFTSNGNVFLLVDLETDAETKAKILFKVVDTGIGIDSKDMDHIFDKFRHGSDEIKQKYGGSGIGLFVVKHFLLLHNSQISVHSEKGNKTAFSFSIWFDKAFGSEKSDSTNKKGTGNILLVDDNQMNLTLTKRLLESNGFNCDTTESGFDALEILRTRSYDLILMDIMMPGINGFETTRKIRQENIQEPIVALTAIDIEQNKEDFEQADFSAVLTKPLRPDNFFKTIKKILIDRRNR